MAISYPRTLPATPGVKSNRLKVEFNVDLLESPVTKQRNTDEKQGHRWEGMFVYPKMLPAQAQEWKAWFLSMHGIIQQFYAADPDHTTPFGTADTGSDTPLVDGASQTGRTLVTKGWRLSEVGLLLPGDYFHVLTASGLEYKMVTETLSSDGSGDGTISFDPPLHASPADNAVIVFENPKGTFVMEENSVPWESDEFGKHDFAISFVESF